MNYRDTLYGNYSASFGEAKAFEPGVQFPQYEVTYPVSALSRDASILDVGCGKGEWLAWMMSKGFRSLTGVDGAPSDLKIASGLVPNADCRESFASPFLASQSNAFDLIHAKDVAEHMTKNEFIEFLQLSYQALRPNGQLWLLTFNAQAPLAGATRYGDFTHESGLTPRSAAQCLRACGFSQIEVRGLHYCSSSISGRLRHLLSLPVSSIARLMLKLRHGGGGESGIDVFCSTPDLFVVGGKA